MQRSYESALNHAPARRDASCPRGSDGPDGRHALAAHVGFIHLHRRTLQLHVALSQQATQLLKNAPCGFLGHASFALNLFRGDAAPSPTHEVHGVGTKS